MVISPKKVDNEPQYYLKEAIKHIWKNFNVYLIAFAFMGATGFLLSFLEQRAFDFLKVFFSILFTFFLVEITISSTQEKMSFKKIVICFFIACVSVKRFFVQLKNSVLGMIGFGVYMLPYFITAPENAHMKADILLKIWLYSSFTLSGFIIVVSLWTRILVIDEHVVARTMDDFGKGREDVINQLCAEGSRINKEFLTSAFFIGMLFTFLNNLTPFGLLFNMTVVALTLYSMDVYGLDRGRLVKQKQEEKSYAELPLPDTA